MTMNEPKDIQPITYTIEMISQRRLEKSSSYVILKSAFTN